MCKQSSRISMFWSVKISNVCWTCCLSLVNEQDGWRAFGCLSSWKQTILFKNIRTRPKQSSEVERLKSEIEWFCANVYSFCVYTESFVWVLFTDLVASSSVICPSCSFHFACICVSSFIVSSSSYSLASLPHPSLSLSFSPSLLRSLLLYFFKFFLFFPLSLL